MPSLALAFVAGEIDRNLLYFRRIYFLSRTNQTYMTNINLALMSQPGVEQATGLSREVLRKWELRYQFPIPLRGARGQRLYAPEDVVRLQLIKSGLNRGLRPGKLVPLSLDDLHALLATQAPMVATPDETVLALLACLSPTASPHAARACLEPLIQAQGLAYFVDELLPAFNRAVGEAWVAGRLGVHAEHHYTETVRNVVLRALAHRPPTHTQPRLLLTTPPGELHGLGLLALQVALSLQGADCVCLGTQTPVPDVVQAVRDLGIQLVAISVSVCLPPQAMRAYISTLRQGLPDDCVLWVGGQGCAPLKGQEPPGVTVFQSTHQAVQAWLALAPSLMGKLK